MKNIKLHIAFVSLSNNFFAIVSKNKDNLDNDLSKKKSSLEVSNSLIKEQFNFYSYTTEIVIRSIKDKTIHSKVSELFNEDNIFIFKNIRNSNEFINYLEVISSEYNGDVDWIKFLNSSKIGDKWINGHLTVEINNIYEEYSRNFGSKKKSDTVLKKLENCEDIWDFKDLFKGSEKFVDGDKFWYSNKSYFSKIVE